MYAKALRVLVVNDNSTWTCVAQRIFAALGQDSVTADTGLEALRLLANESFDLILIELSMSDFKTVDTIRSIRLMAAHARTPIIGLTDQVNGDRREMCLEMGLNDALSKPLRVQHLKEAVNKYLMSPLVPHTEQTAAAPADGILSHSILQGLRLIDDNEGVFVNELIDFFVALTPPVIARLVSALAADKEEETVSLAHKLKGMCRNLGILSLSATLDDIEMGYLSLSPMKKLSLAAKIQMEFDEAVSCLHSHWYRRPELT